MEEKIKICICGGGNGAHVMAGLAAAHARTEVQVLTLYQDEAVVWTEKMKQGDLIIARNNPDRTVEEIKAKPAVITKDAGQATQNADVIIFCVPAFAHKQYFEAIAPYVKENMSIIGLPGQPGFEFQCLDILKDKARSCTILDYESLPWACRLAEFGRKVDLLATKDSLIGSLISGKSQPKHDPVELLQLIFGEHPILIKGNNYLETVLMVKGFAHPALMYGHWMNWDGKPVEEKPLFYQGLTEFAASVLWDVSQEIVNTAKAISKARPEVTMENVEHFESWIIRNYRHTIQDPTNLYTAMKTNTAYGGLVHPMQEISPGKYIPDFHHRYLEEDVPYGLAVTKGVAQIVGVATPCTDKVITWAQGHLGKEFLVGSELKGKEFKDTRAPQAFGLNTLDDLLSLM
ncbi:hypothetical protein V1264_008943 [Littorina saxatilis]